MTNEARDEAKRRKDVTLSNIVHATVENGSNVDSKNCNSCVTKHQRNARGPTRDGTRSSQRKKKIGKEKGSVKRQQEARSL